LLFAGSAAYGTPMPNSDVDLYVLIGPNWRQRRNRFIQGVEVEMFINPVAQIRREFDEGEWATVDMFSRGRVHYDPTGWWHNSQRMPRGSQPNLRKPLANLSFISSGIDRQILFGMSRILSTMTGRQRRC